jgi:hypothetical protein
MMPRKLHNGPRMRACLGAEKPTGGCFPPGSASRGAGSVGESIGSGSLFSAKSEVGAALSVALLTGAPTVSRSMIVPKARQLSARTVALIARTRLSAPCFHQWEST